MARKKHGLRNVRRSQIEVIILGGAYKTTAERIDALLRLFNATLERRIAYERERCEEKLKVKSIVF